MPQFLKYVFASLLGTFLALGIMLFGVSMMILGTVSFFSGPKFTTVKTPSDDRKGLIYLSTCQTAQSVFVVHTRPLHLNKNTLIP